MTRPSSLQVWSILVERPVWFARRKCLRSMMWNWSTAIQPSQKCRGMAYLFNSPILIQCKWSWRKTIWGAHRNTLHQKLVFAVLEIWGWFFLWLHDHCHLDSSLRGHNGCIWAHAVLFRACCLNLSFICAVPLTSTIVSHNNNRDTYDWHLQPFLPHVPLDQHL